MAFARPRLSLPMPTASGWPRFMDNTPSTAGIRLRSRARLWPPGPTTVRKELPARYCCVATNGGRLETGCTLGQYCCAPHIAILIFEVVVVLASSWSRERLVGVLLCCRGKNGGHVFGADLFGPLSIVVSHSAHGLACCPRALHRGSVCWSFQAVQWEWGRVAPPCAHKCGVWPLTSAACGQAPPR